MDIAFYNGVVYTSDGKLPEAQAFWVRDGRFVLVGRNEDVASCPNKVDLRGRCVIPGLVDSHCHIINGLQRASLNVLNVSPEIRPEELADALLAEEAPPGNGVVVAMGIDLTRGTFRAEHVDPAFPSRPAMVFSEDGHALLLNRVAIERLHIDESVENPSEDSYFVRDGDGRPTGLVIEIPAMMLCRPLLEDRDTGIMPAKAFQSILDAYAALGYTTVFDAMTADGEAEDFFPLLLEFEKNGQMSLRISTSFCYHGKEFCPMEDALEQMRELRKSIDSPNLRANTLKLILDGTLEEHSALMFSPYADKEDHCGSELIETEDMTRMAEIAVKEGFDIHIHAIGDKAVSRALDVLCGLGSIKGTKTIAHNQVYRAEDIERMAQAGDIIFQTTPHWMVKDDYTLARLGKERYLLQFPIGTMRAHGVPVSFGSDTCLDEPLANAFAGMYFAVARGDETESEQIIPPRSEGISREEALKAYTIAGAEQLGWGAETGSITAGKSADFLVLDRDPMHCPLRELSDTQVEETWFRGKAVHRME